jgi:K+-transporting ATPase KdpF subunit
VPVRLLPHHPGQVTRDSTDRVSGGRPLIWLTVLVTLFLLVYLLVALLRPEKF